MCGLYSLPVSIGSCDTLDETLALAIMKLSVRTWARPSLPGFQFMRAYNQIASVHSDFGAACAAVPDGMGWLGPIRFLALKMLRILWVWPTTV